MPPSPPASRYSVRLSPGSGCFVAAGKACKEIRHPALEEGDALRRSVGSSEIGLTKSVKDTLTQRSP